MASAGWAGDDEGGRIVLGKRITESEFRAALRHAEQAPRWLDIDADAMRGHYNRTGFQVRHRLAEHPLFTADALFKLARRMPVSAVKYRFGSVPGNTHFDSSIERFRGDLTLDDALDHLVEKRAYVALYNPENLGTIIRIADVFGVDAILTGESCPDPFSRRVLRV